VEINVRPTVFYPARPGINYITVRGFTLCHAATQWAPPTAEQVGLIGTHWSRGWIIENNVISDSRCSGITLGKYGDEWDNRSASSAGGYYKTIERALQNGWNRETIGHHIVRNNTIFNCEQAGICGSLGAVFSQLIANHIYSIYTRRQFFGYEMAGIKIHAAIDVLLANNRIHNAYYGIWLDWMAQGTRVSANLCYDNSDADLLMEMNHGPFVADNNLLLSKVSIYDQSQGGAYAHNLIGGIIKAIPDGSRHPPYHKAHSTELAGVGRVVGIIGGDNRFYNNLLVGDGVTRSEDEIQAIVTKEPHGRKEGLGLWVYDTRTMLLQTGGNVYCSAARPYRNEPDAVRSGTDPKIKVVEDGDRVYLHLTLDDAIQKAKTALVTTELLGKAKISELPYENFDGAPLKIQTDYFGKQRSEMNPTTGPFENPGRGELGIRVW